MNTQYICELYFDKETSDQQELMKLALQSLGFIPTIMSIYVSMDEMYEEVSYSEDLLFSVLSKEDDSGITITQHIYDENTTNPWFRFGKEEGKFVSLKWSNENMDFLLAEKITHFLKINGFAAGYVFDNKDAWEQSREAKENSELSSVNYPGQFKYVCGMQFMAAPLMWFGEPFFEIISKDELLKFSKAQKLNTDLVEVKLFNIYESPEKSENRIAQKNFWTFFELDKVVTKFEEENSIDAVQALNDFLAKMKSPKKK
jgi:hypothetical protein